ncbi:DNA primase [Alphaproteobacteria bacterium]|nr:DNA primase [Alphaproteobacteria bacterium]
MSFSKNDLEKIKSKISIRSVLEKKHKIIIKGKDYWCCCPFHEEKTPSCKINEDQQSFYCFGCGAKGDIFTLYTDLYNYSFIDSVKELSQQSGVQINFDNISKTNQENKIEEILKITSEWYQNNLTGNQSIKCNQYLQNRKLKSETIKKFKLGYSHNSESTLYEYLKKKSFKDDDLLKSNVIKLDKNNKIRDYFYKRLIFPIMNNQGTVVGFGGRALDDSNPKYINSPESKFFQKRYLLYNLNNAKYTARKKNNLLICEGYMDVISLYQNGILSVVAPLGTSLTPDQLELAWRYSSRPTIMFDGDSAGIRASYKSAIMSLSLINSKKFLQFVNLPIGFDPDSYINEVSLNQLIKKLKNPQSLVDFIFNESSKSITLEKADEKISYDEYLDNLIELIKDKKIQYFYKNEFKSLFFNKIREQRKPKKNNVNNNTKEINLNKKQNLSFIAAAINHKIERRNIIDKLLSSDLFMENEIEFIKFLKKPENIDMENSDILSNLDRESFRLIFIESVNTHIYQLFPYSSPLFDPQKALKDVSKSLNNLNTRLLNLKKINKSLDDFAINSNSLNWNELQKINIENKYED